MNSIRPLALRLLPGEDLRTALDAHMAKDGIGAACVLSCSGSLNSATVRFAGEPELTMLVGPFEIVSLSGTLSKAGSHLAIAMADQKGNVVGGHVKEGCAINTTVEIVIGILDGIDFARELDPFTGFRELVVKDGS
jgi:uncharacterized protein